MFYFIIFDFVIMNCDLAKLRIDFYTEIALLKYENKVCSREDIIDIIDSTADNMIKAFIDV